jgi:predicted enzyme related to lactoylglutathione lyase
MTLTLGMITFDATRPGELAAWWARQLGREAVDASGGGGYFYAVCAPEGQPAADFGFQLVEDPTPGKNRIHLDLGSADPAAEVKRLLADGATLVGEHEFSGFGWTVLADPEGNQFCVASNEH